MEGLLDTSEGTVITVRYGGSWVITVEAGWAGTDVELTETTGAGGSVTTGVVGGIVSVLAADGPSVTLASQEETLVSDAAEGGTRVG